MIDQQLVDEIGKNKTRRSDANENCRKAGKRFEHIEEIMATFGHMSTKEKEAQCMLPEEVIRMKGLDLVRFNWVDFWNPEIIVDYKAEDERDYQAMGNWQKCCRYPSEKAYWEKRVPGMMNVNQSTGSRARLQQ